MRVHELFETTFSSEITDMVSKQPYRAPVLTILQSWSTLKIRNYIIKLTDEQYDDSEQQNSMLNTIDKTAMIEYLAKIIFNWGWDGTNDFIKRNSGVKDIWA